MANFFRLSSLLVALVTFLQFLAPGVLAAGPTHQEDVNGGYWYEEVDSTTVQTMQAGTIKNSAKQEYEGMVAQAKKDKVAAVPPVYTVLFIPNKAVIGASSIHAPAGHQSTQTCNIIQNANHRYYGNCAEMNAIAIAVNRGWATVSASGAISLPAGSSISAYGIKDKNGGVGWLKPCDAKDGYPGCSNHIPSTVKVVTRDVDETLKAVEFVA